jgi:hypothetical protein
MDQLRAQLGNYLEWLESRGLTGTVTFRMPENVPTEPGSEAVAAPAVVPSHEPQQTDARAPKAELVQAPPVMAPRPAEDMSRDLQADLRSAAALRSTPGPGPAARQSEAPKSEIPAAQEPKAPQRENAAAWKVGFYSSSDLTEQEFIMVSKIALALGLPAEDFKIWAEDSLVHVPLDLLRCSYIVALGPGSGQTLLALGQTVVMNTIQKALQGSPLLTIPHPRAMLREPPLKAGAWTALQKFKALMVH